MPVATFDTLKYSKALRDAGVSEPQAEAHATVLSEILSVNLKELVTKDDLKSEIALVRADFKAEITKLSGEMVLMKWMLGVVLTLCVGIAVRLFLLPVR